MDRRTNRTEGSGRASSTVVTSRVADEDLLSDEPADSAAADGARDVDQDATLIDAVPALPADTLKPSRPARPKGRSTPVTGADGQGGGEPGADGASGGKEAAPAVSAEPSAAASAGARTGAKGGTPPPTVPSGTVSSAAATSSSSAAGQASSSSAAGRASAEPPSATVSAAAFAWDMPDPPPDSPSSPARAFLRSGPRSGEPPKGAKGPKGEREPLPSPTTARTAAPDPGKTEAASSARSLPQQTVPKRSARQAHLTVARVEPWSVMKFSFVVSLVAFVILFVAVSLLYGVLSGLGVFDSLQRVVNSVTSSQSSAGVNAKAWFSASRVLGYTALLGSLNIVLITAMSTIGAVIYNLSSRLVGGVEVTLRETELASGPPARGT